MYKQEISQFSNTRNFYFDNTANTDFTAKKPSTFKKITFVDNHNKHDCGESAEQNGGAPINDDDTIISKAIEIQQHLCDLGNMINSYFQLQILIIILISFIIIVFDSYYILELFIGVEGIGKGMFYHQFRYNIMASYLYQLGGYALNIVFIVYFCTKTMNTAKRTGKILHRMLNRNMSKDLQFKLLLFSQQLLHTNFEFAPYGFFPLNGTLIYAIVGATTTYLVILLQFTTDSQPSGPPFPCNATTPQP